MPKKGAKERPPVLDSRDANAYNNFNCRRRRLTKSSRIEVDRRAMLKPRCHGAPRARGVRIAQRNSHILVQVSDGKREA